jgi:Cu2+-containing amine oxidase
MPEDGARAPHPLDPLTETEIRQIAGCVRRGPAAGPGWRFASIELTEPAKEAPAPGAAGPRAAMAVCWNREDGQAYRARVALPEPGAAAAASTRTSRRTSGMSVTRCSALTRRCSRRSPPVASPTPISR